MLGRIHSVLLALQDRHRTFSILFLLLPVSIICWYSSYTGQNIYPLLENYLANPESHDGAKVVIWHEAKSGGVYEDGFELRQFGSIIRVYGSPEDLGPNEDVNVEGVFHKEGYLTLTDMHIHGGRRMKIVVSVLPVLIVVWLFYREYRFDLRKMMFFRRS